MTALTSKQLINRHTLIWLLFAQGLVILPLLFYLPWWLFIVWFVCVAWRVQVYRMKCNFPSVLIRLGLVLVVAIGIFFTRKSILNLEGCSVILIAAFLLKLLELRAKRDALIILYLGFFSIALSYLFSNSFLWVVYSLLPLIALLSAMIALQEGGLNERPSASIRLAVILFLQAIPFMLILFFCFPRFEPLWTLPGPKTQQKSGLSNSMTPGELADMVQSGSLAFRANFQGNIPARRQLYWRMLTLENYDGRTWSQAHDVMGLSMTEGPVWNKRSNEQNGVTYTVVMQPTGKPWLAALDVPDHLPNNVHRQADFHLQRLQPIDSTYSYTLTSWLAATRESTPTRRMALDLRLPANQDPRAIAWAKALRERTRGDVEKIVYAVLNHYKQETYRYTLKTPDLGSNSVDAFFFDTRSGFCEHYASATAFILRAAGVPARVVMGYQGGEINEAGHFVQVTQAEAHAWVEYWSIGRGWTSIDPTFQVAPERIERGLESSLTVSDQQQLGQEGGFLSTYKGNSWLGQLRLTWQLFNNRWDLFILGYDSDQQKGILQKLIGQANLLYMGFFLLGGFFVAFGVWYLLLLKPWKRQKNVMQQSYQHFESLLSRQGLHREAGEGPIDFAKRAKKQLPSYGTLIDQFVIAFIANYYANKPAINKLHKSLKALQHALGRKNRFRK